MAITIYLRSTTTHAGTLGSHGNNDLETTTATTATQSIGANTPRTYVYYSAASFPGLLDWQTGDYTYNIDVSTANANVQLTSLKVSRYDSSLSTEKASGTATPNLTLNTTGLKTGTITFASPNPAGRASDDRLVLTITISKLAGGGVQSAVIDLNGSTDSRLDTPITLPVIRDISEDSISVSDSIATNELYVKPISEDSISISENLDDTETYIKPISEGSISASDSLEGTKIPAPTNAIYDVHFVEFPEEISDSLYVPAPTQVEQVSTTKTHKFSILEQVSKAAVHVYNIISVVTASKTHKYNVLQQITQSKTHKFNILETVSTVVKTHLYHVIAAITQSKTHKYDILEQIDSNKTHKFNVSSSATQVSTTKTHKYNIEFGVIATRTHKYHVEGKVSVVKTHRWNTLETVTAQKTHIFNLLEGIALSATHKYNILETVSTTKTHKYDIISALAAVTKTHKYDISGTLYAVSTTKTHIFSILEKITSQKTHEFNIFEYVTLAKTHLYNLAGKVTITKSHLFNILEKVTFTKQHRYNLLESVETITKTHKYSILSAVSLSTTHKYNTIGQITSSHTHLYDMGGKVLVTKWHRYDVSTGLLQQELGGSTHALIRFPARIKIIDIFSNINNKAIANVEIIPELKNVAIATVVISEFQTSDSHLLTASTLVHKPKIQVASGLILPEIIDTIENVAIAPYIAVEILELPHKPSIQLLCSCRLETPKNPHLVVTSSTQIKDDDIPIIKVASATKLLVSIPKNDDKKNKSISNVRIPYNLGNQTFKVESIMPEQRAKKLKVLIDLLKSDHLFE